MKPRSQNARILSVLADGKPHTVPEIHRRAGTSRLNSRVAELRGHGHTIVCTRTAGKQGAHAYRYQWVDAPPMPPRPEPKFVLDNGDVAPRDERNRYRIYRLTADALLELVATCATKEAVGVTICTLGAEDEFPAGTAVGVLDTHGTDAKAGEWILSPFNPAAWSPA